MTKKDLNFLVEVRIPKSEGDDTAFFVTLGQLHDAIVTHPSGNITFRIGDELLQMERSNVIEIYNLAKQQLITAKSTVPVQLKDYLIDLSASKKSTQTEKISSRDEEIEKLWSCMLLKQKSNAIIVGEHGVGKTTMFLEVVRQLRVGEAPSEMSSFKIIQLNTSKLLKIKSDINMKHVVSAIVKYLKENKNNIILYVDDLLTMKYDIYLAQLLIIILKKLNVKFVASITYENYENYFEADDTICKYLNPIYLTEPDIEDIYEIVLSIVAYHEAGHYLVVRYSENLRAYKNAYVSILPFKNALGQTTSYEEVGKQLTFDKEFFIDQIANALGGRVGEEMYTNKYSSGALGDLDMASTMAEQIIMSYGLSNREDEKNKSYTIAGMYVKDFLLTDDIKKEINKEITELIKEGYERATKIIHEHKELHEIIVSKLLEEGVLMGTELDKICKEFEENQKK